MKIRITKTTKITGIIILCYIAFSDLFGTFQFEAFISGRVYDYIFVFILGLLIYRRFKKKHVALKVEKEIERGVDILILYGLVGGIVLVIKQQQGILLTIFTLRDMYYIFGYIFFMDSMYDVRKVIKTIVMLEMIMCVVNIIITFVGPASWMVVRGGYTSANVFRLYCNFPFTYFTLPILVYSCGRKNYLYNKYLDYFFIILYFVTLIVRQGRTALFVAALISIIAYIFFVDRQSIIRGLKLFLMSFFLVLFAWISLPQFTQRVFEGVVDIMNWGGFSNTANTTFEARTVVLYNRFLYLKNISSLWFGLGPLHGEGYIFENIGYGVHDIANNGIISGDSDWATILFRYGLVGVFLFFFCFGNIIFHTIHSQNILMRCVALMAIGMVLSAINSVWSLNFGAFFEFGIIYGIALKAEKQKIWMIGEKRESAL